MPIVAALIASSLLARARTADAWDIKPSFETGKKLAWAVAANISMSGTDVTAKFDHVVTPDEADKDGNRKLKISWTNVQVNGGDSEAPEPFEVKIGSDGGFKECLTPTDDEYRRVLSPFSFAYPPKPVQVSDKWTIEVTPKAASAKKMKYAFEAAEVTKVGDTDVMKITSKMTEDGPDGMSSDGTWWVAKDGSIVKFKLDLKNWIVPFAGAGLLEGTLTGTKK